MLIFRHYISRSKLLFTTAFAGIFLTAFLITAGSSQHVNGGAVFTTEGLALVALRVALVVLVLIALGCHRPEVCSSWRLLLERLGVAGVIGCGAIVLAQRLMLGQPPRVTVVAMAVFGGCAAVIAAYGAGWHSLLLRTNPRPRTLVLGCGPKASIIWHLTQRNNLDVELLA
jgi:hypothetical protein